MPFLSMGWNENRAERKNATSSLCLPRPGFGCLHRVKRCSLVTRCGRLLGSLAGQSVRWLFGHCLCPLSSVTPPPTAPTWERKITERESRNKWLCKWKKTNAGQLLAVFSSHKSALGGTENTENGCRHFLKWVRQPCWCQCPNPPNIRLPLLRQTEAHVWCHVIGRGE